MKILLVNKYLYLKGGAETYVIKLGEYLSKIGHEVEYFGLLNEKNIVSNRLDLHVKELDLTHINIKSILNVYKLINSKEAKEKISRLLNAFIPDLIIVNNIEYYLTPSIIEAIGEYKKKNNAKLLYVAHDYQLICPSHGLFDNKYNLCEKCLNGDYWNCFKTKCLKNSRIKSLIGSIDSKYWHKKNVYKYVDKIICPSFFLKNKLDNNKQLKNKTITIQNFIYNKQIQTYKKEDYIVYFGYLSKEKGVELLLNVAEQLKHISFIFAGYGPLEKKVEKHKNAKYIGFKKEEELTKIISKARLSICPSICYENCPFSIIEAQICGTPVLGSNIGGIPELINIGRTGEVFESGNAESLKTEILKLWNDKKNLDKYAENCKSIKRETIDSYAKKIMNIYRGEKNENY